MKKAIITLAALLVLSGTAYAQDPCLVGTSQILITNKPYVVTLVEPALTTYLSGNGTTQTTTNKFDGFVFRWDSGGPVAIPKLSSQITLGPACVGGPFAGMTPVTFRPVNGMPNKGDHKLIVSAYISVASTNPDGTPTTVKLEGPTLVIPFVVADPQIDPLPVYPPAAPLNGRVSIR